MASGAGTVVDINTKNYYYNYGYASGANQEVDVMTGRSFGASPGHRANDASEPFYLRELGRYLTSTDDVAPFYQTMLETVTLSKGDGIGQLTFVSAFGTAVGKVMQGGRIVDGGPELYWAESTITPGRSGIGETRTDRRKLQRMITTYERQMHPQLVAAVESAVGHSGTDSFAVTMAALNNSAFLNNPTAAEHRRQ
jgi:hypothetical protein